MRSRRRYSLLMHILMLLLVRRRLLRVVTIRHVLCPGLRTSSMASIS